jgi:hypothetical protein
MPVAISKAAWNKVRQGKASLLLRRTKGVRLSRLPKKRGIPPVVPIYKPALGGIG